MTKHFEVEYDYYQYNSGAADNGEYTRVAVVPTAEQALDLARRINKDAQHYKKEEYREVDDKLADRLIPYAGYFLEARIFAVERTEVPTVPCTS